MTNPHTPTPSNSEAMIKRLINSLSVLHQFRGVIVNALSGDNEALRSAEQAFDKAHANMREVREALAMQSANTTSALSLCSHAGTCAENAVKHDGAFCANPPTTGSDELVEIAAKAFADASGYYVPFHRGLSSPSADKLRAGIRAALNAIAAPSPAGSDELVERDDVDDLMDRLFARGDNDSVEAAKTIRAYDQELMSERARSADRSDADQDEYRRNWITCQDCGKVHDRRQACFLNAIATPDTDRVAVLTEALREIAAMDDGRKLNWGDAQDAIDIASAALSQPLGSQER